MGALVKTRVAAEQDTEMEISRHRSISPVVVGRDRWDSHANPSYPEVRCQL